MKKFFLQHLLAFFICILTLQANAQTTRKAILTGDTCAGNTLTGSFPYAAITELRWYKDSVLAEARGRYESLGTVIAKGNPPDAWNLLYDIDGIYLYKGYLYILQGQSVYKWQPGATKGTVVAGGNGKGSALNQFYSPVGIALDNAGDIYISDYLTNSVRKWHPGASAGTIVAGGNGYGAGANQFANPMQLCIDRFGNLYISDRYNSRVQKWAPGATSGVTVAGGNGKGTAANQLYEPSGVAVDYAGNVYVSDQYSYRVQKWAPGATTGVTVAGGNGQGSNANQLLGPGDLSVDSAGTLYIMDGGKRVQRWDPGATYGVTVAGGNYYPQGTPEDSKVKYSRGLFVDANKQIYIGDFFDDRVRKFKITSPLNSVITNVGAGTYQFEVTAINNQVYKSDKFKITAIPPYPGQVGGPNEVVKYSTVKFDVKNYDPKALYTWTVPYNATILSGQGTYKITVKWGLNNGDVTVTASNSCGSSKTRVKPVISPCSVDEDTPPYPAQVGGPNIVNKQSIVKYDVKNAPEGTSYTWSFPPDVSIISGQNTSLITVKWGDNSGPIQVTAYNGCFISQTRTKSITVAPTVRVLSENTAPTATIYPNPTANSASVAFTTEKASAYELTVTNMAGKPLLKQKGTAQAGKNTTDLNISNFNRGVYLVNIKYDDNTTQVLKISKQ